MRVFVECKADETTVVALGVPKRQVEHATGRSGVCSQLSKREGVTGMMDEDPHAEPAPYMKSLAEKSWEHEVRLCLDKQRGNRAIIISPRLEEWIVDSAKSGGVKLTDFGFESNNGVRLHAEVNNRLENLEKLVKFLLEKQSPRILRLQSLLLGKF
jgi:hypothetical protein